MTATTPNTTRTPAYWRVLVVPGGRLAGLTADGLRTDTEGNLRVHLREKRKKSATRLYCPTMQTVCGKSSPSTVAKPSNSKYLLPLTALPKDMPLHYLRAQYAQDLYRYFAERVQQRGTCTIAERNAKGKPTIKVSYWRYPSRWGTAAAMWWYLTIYIRRYLP